MIRSLQLIIPPINRLESLADRPFEAWDSVLYQGAFSDQFLQAAFACFEEFEKIGYPDACGLWLDDERVSLDELRATETRHRPPATWRFSFNKDNFLNSEPFGNEDVKQVLFCSMESFNKWASGNIHPFSFDEKLFHGQKPLRIYVDGLREAFGGPRLAVCPIQSIELPKAWLGPLGLPSDPMLRTHIHVAAPFDARLEPAAFLLSWGAINSQAAEPFRRLCAINLAACLTQDFFDIDRVVLNGTKRLQLPLVQKNDIAPSANQLRELLKAVEWAFSENPETRVLLLVDRLSLDIPANDSLVAGICDSIETALDHARNKYRFVILERKNEYAKELASLQKDIRIHTDAFAEKVRGLLSGLLRDVLAALLLLGVGLFARFIKDINVLNTAEAGLLFKAFSIYFLISIFLQGFIQLRDISLSEKEILYWADITRNHMGKEEVKSHVDEAIKSRRINYYFQGGIIALVYVCLSLLSWNIQATLKYWGIIP